MCRDETAVAARSWIGRRSLRCWSRSRCVAASKAAVLAPALLVVSALSSACGQTESPGPAAGGAVNGPENAWEFCEFQPGELEGPGGSSVVLRATTRCSSPYVPVAEDANTGDDLLAVSLRSALQARAIAGRYSIASDNEPLASPLPWCVRGRDDSAKASSPGSLTASANSAIHRQPVEVGGGVLEIRASLNRVSDLELEGPTRTLFAFGDRVLETAECGAPEGDRRRLRHFEFDEGSLTFETRLAVSPTFGSMSETWVSAVGTLDGTPFDVSDYFSFAAVTNQGGSRIAELGAVLDAPIGGVCGFRTDLEHLYATACDLTVLRELVVSHAEAEDLPL